MVNNVEELKSISKLIRKKVIVFQKKIKLYKRKFC